MKLYGLKNCDTCRKALKALPEVTFVDVRSEGVPHDVLERALEMFADALVNTRSTTWRNLSEAERAEAPIALLSQHPALMKRPLIEDGTEMYLGWTKQTQDALLG